MKKVNHSEIYSLCQAFSCLPSSQLEYIFALCAKDGVSKLPLLHGGYDGTFISQDEESLSMRGFILRFDFKDVPMVKFSKYFYDFVDSLGTTNVCEHWYFKKRFKDYSMGLSVLNDPRYERMDLNEISTRTGVDYDILYRWVSFAKNQRVSGVSFDYQVVVDMHLIDGYSLLSEIDEFFPKYSNA